jgi:prepilin-type processing-associated H-X9-DG protein
LHCATWAAKILPYIEQGNMLQAWNFTTPIKTFMDPGRGGTGLSSVPWSGKCDNTMYSAGPVTDYAANFILIGSTLNTIGPANAPTYENGKTNEFRRNISGISDGTSNTIMVGTKAIATQCYGGRGPVNFTATNGGTSPCQDNAITDPGNERAGTLRAWGPDTTWYWAGTPAAFDPSNPYKTNIPGSKYTFAAGRSWQYGTYVVIQDVPDVNAPNSFGSPYAGGAPIAMCDGSVRVISYSITFRELIPLVTPNGGEVNSGDF